MSADPMDRFNDLNRQGFMRGVKVRRKAKPVPVMVACDGCLNWHARNRHTSDKATREARYAAGASRTQRPIGGAP